MKTKHEHPPAVDPAAAATAVPAPPEAQSRTATVDQLIQTLSADLAKLTRTKGELGLALVDDPKNADIVERIEANEEQLAAVSRRLELYRQARIQAASQEKADRATVQVLHATASRDKAVEAAQKRIKIAERLDSCFSDLARTLRDWRDINEEVKRSVHETVRTACSNTPGFDHTRQSKFDAASVACPRDFAANEIIVALKRAGVDESTAGCVELRPNSNGWTVEFLANATVRAEAERAIPRMQTILDATLRDMSVGAA